MKGIVDLWQPLSPKWVLVAYGSYADAWANLEWLRQSNLSAR